MKVDILSFSSLFNWWWLPTFGTRVLLSFCYSSGLVAKPPVDAVHRRNSHFQLARVVVIVATLAYQFLSSVSSAAPNYYQLLALPLDVDADGVKRSFRALARRYHPDKVGPQGEAFFIVLRKAHDALSDPVKRFAYDRFGPQITEWKDCQTPRDFMVKGLTGLVAFYTVNPAMYALLGYLNSRSDSVSFWRLACLFALLALELAILVSPDYPAWLAILMPNTTIHDFLQLAHRFFVDFFFASLQLSSALDVIEYGDEAAPPRSKKAKAQTLSRNMEIVRIKSESIDKDAHLIASGMVQLLAQDFRPYRSVDSTPSPAAGPGFRSKSPEEERIFDRIEQALLVRRVVQRQPQLAQLA
ncbi:DnaJ-domain-containing protein, partial [Testicularia cyperi]